MQTLNQLREHYVVEKELANRLRAADRSSRGPLYGRVYDELLRRVPHHPYRAERDDAEVKQRNTVEQLAFLSRFLRPDSVFLEIGAGDCTLSRAVARRVKTCYALDVSREMLDTRAESNLKVMISDGCSVPVADGSVTVAYSNQVMEHIHPEDAVEQLGNIYRALAPGGVYLCITPNRLNGPHDVSREFDDVATGLHLREYTLRELTGLFHQAGFLRPLPYVRWNGRYIRLPLRALIAFERLIESLPVRTRKRIGRMKGVRNLLFLHLAATK